MSAEQYGARLLQGVQEESLEQFLAELRWTVEPQPRAVLGVPQLDTLLESLRYPETLANTRRREWLSSPAATSVVYGSDDDRSNEEEDSDDVETSRLRPQPRASAEKPKPATVELTSVSSASGKTSLLSYLCAISVLPRDLGGKESTVVYIDSDGRFSAARLAQIMLHHVQNHQSKASKETPSTLTDSGIQQVIRSSLDHIHVFRPQSSAQLISTLSSLHAYLFDGSRHHSMHRPLSLIVIDSATAFYWQDRSDQAMAQLESPGTGLRGGGPSPSRAAQAIEILKTLQEKFACAVVFSAVSTISTPPFPSSSTRPPHDTTTSGPTILAPAASDTRFVSPWTSYATLSLSLARLPIAQFPAQMGLEECLRDREKRLDAVHKGRFLATLVPGSGSAPLAAPAATAKGRAGKEDGESGTKAIGGSAFEFRITGAGVEFE
ncbi:hypothetical protein FOPE_11731 [Fonsecaea pedrosoi]|nr:hypothetical protein FOPE_11731 [Fonsecaea pedrosoi]